ncbi:HAD-IIB family hydrolase [Seongchinamella sediminis]|uniref:HAD-IIB family hydrolase n=1 Tax=Seongchinamella sediminis TaxID=2283635 RepID=A0A3L7DW64_9GAMM|nr:HAD family hydrolase [Seongchinamella sediminis]RLQ21366.1 HAD-IIB family hydrolase [Seongchinamella sediminis]
MDLIVFDLDGTLLNRESRLSDYTRDTLRMLGEQGIAYTVATGRTLHASRDLLRDNGFALPHVYKNGVVIWNPGDAAYSHRYLLTTYEVRHILEAFLSRGVTPFLFTLEPDGRHAVYHPPLQTQEEHRLARMISSDRGLPVLPAASLPGDAELTNISALGPRSAIEAVTALVADDEHLVAYMGNAIEGNDLYWVDVHHSAGSKGSAVAVLKEELAVTNVVCFGDSDNDLSMFATADECYAPANAKEAVRAAATTVIGHHDEDGIARFLRERFRL